MSSHLIPGFGPLELEALEAAERDAVSGHLDTCPSCEREFGIAAEAVSAIPLALSCLDPPPGLLERILDGTYSVGRFDPLAEKAAALVEVPLDEMRDLLARLDDPSSWRGGLVPDVSLLSFKGGPAFADSVVAFVRITAGGQFPEHSHRGDEVVLVLQGSCPEESGQIARRGDLVRMREGSAHVVHALPGPDLIMLAIARGGITMGGAEILPGDPRL